MPGLPAGSPSSKVFSPDCAGEGIAASVPGLLARSPSSKVFSPDCAGEGIAASVPGLLGVLVPDCLAEGTVN